MIMAKECENCAYKSDFKSPKCGTCMVSYYDGEQRGLPSNFKPKPQTNADRIRAMSDEELANFMAERSVNEYTVNLLNENHALTAVQIEALKHRVYCACMKWLKQPAEE
jgi:hypothetical protein